MLAPVSQTMQQQSAPSPYSRMPAPQTSYPQGPYNQPPAPTQQQQGMYPVCKIFFKRSDIFYIHS